MDLATPAIPPRPVRVLSYAVGWMLTIGVVTLVMARLDPLCHFLYDRDELPKLTRIFWGFTRLNNAGCSSAAILLLLSLLMLDEVVVRTFGERSRYSRLWFVFWLLVGVAINVLFLVAICLP